MEARTRIHDYFSSTFDILARVIAECLAFWIRFPRGRYGYVMSLLADMVQYIRFCCCWVKVATTTSRDGRVFHILLKKDFSYMLLVYMALISGMTSQKDRFLQ